MLSRGSAQLLLHFLRLRHCFGWKVGVASGIAIAAGLLFVGGPVVAPDGLAQLLRQSAWDRALDRAAEPDSWPWAGAQAGTVAKVPRLGLSASLADQHPRLAAVGGSRPSGAMLSEVAIGDRITVTTASGASRVYRVTGRKLADPHLAESGADTLDGDAALVDCQPPDPASALQLVIQAITADPPEATLKQEQKL